MVAKVAIFVLFLLHPLLAFAKKKGSTTGPMPLDHPMMMIGGAVLVIGLCYWAVVALGGLDRLSSLLTPLTSVFVIVCGVFSKGAETGFMTLLVLGAVVLVVASVRRILLPRIRKRQRKADQVPQAQASLRVTAAAPAAPVSNAPPGSNARQLRAQPTEAGSALIAAETWTKLGIAEIGAARYQEAIACFERALAAVPGHQAAGDGLLRARQLGSPTAPRGGFFARLLGRLLGRRQ